MRVALVGPAQSGKSTLFSAVAEAGGSHVDLSRPDQPHLAVVKVPDARVDALADHYKPKKITHAELEFLDLPGFDLSDEASRARARTHWTAMRQSDMLVLVTRSFKDDTVPEYRNRIDPVADAEEIKTELLFADLDQVTSRIEKLEASVKKLTVRRDEQLKELELMKRLLEALENEKSVADAVKNDTEARLLRSFAFMSQKPLLVVLNCDEGDMGSPQEELAGLPCIKLSARIEQEIAQLPPEDRSVFLEDLGLKESARDRLIRACYDRLHLISFLTAGEDECRAWTIPAGTDAVTAAEEIHSDIARGFIRAETVSYEDFQAAGDIKGAKAAGHVRLEGKTYIVRDGDIINFRFNV